MLRHVLLRILAMNRHSLVPEKRRRGDGKDVLLWHEVKLSQAETRAHARVYKERFKWGFLDKLNARGGDKREGTTS